MNVYYVTSEILDDRSAMAVHIDEICKNLAALGHTVTLYAPVTTKFHPSIEYKTRFINTSRVLLYVIFQARLFLRLRRDISLIRPDVIYSRNDDLLFIPALIGNLFGIPTVLEVNGRLLEEVQLIDQSLVGRVLLALGVFGFLESFNVRSAAKLIAVAPGIRNYLIQRYKIKEDKVNVVLNGIDIDFFEPTDYTTARKEIGLDSDAIYIGYIGSFYPWQGVQYIVQAAQLVLAQRPQVKFILVGMGKETEYLRSFIKEAKLEQSIEIRPAISHNFVSTYINAFDICICYPTMFRSGSTSPFKVYEYLACGRAVVLADIGGMREEFGDAVAYVEPESAEALSKALAIMIDDKDAREQLGKRGRLFVEQGRSWRAVADRIASLCIPLTHS